MSRFRFYIFPRLCLALSALVLLGGLWVLWLSMGRPMPTQGLACRQAETARFLPHGTTSASGPLRYENGVWFGKADAWAVRRAGDSFTLMELERTAGLLWRSEAIMGGGDLGFPRRTGLLRRVSRGLPRQRDLV